MAYLPNLDAPIVDYMERYALGVEDGRRSGAGARIKDLEHFVPVKFGQR